MVIGRKSKRLSWPYAFCVFVYLTLCTGITAANDTLQCAANDFTVTAKDANDLARTCKAADKGIHLLEGCGLAQRQPVEIEIVSKIDVAGAEDCVGRYECGTNRIKIVGPASLRNVLSDKNPFYVLSSNEYFESIVVHEVSHAIFDQNTEGRGLAEFEYVAYAMQFLSLSGTSRKRVISQIPENEVVDLAELNDFLAASAPIRFGAKAWVHFSKSDNGCAFVTSLVSGRLRLTLPSL